MVTDRSDNLSERGGKPRIRWTLGRKIVGLAGLLLVLLMAVAAYSLVQLRGVGQEIELITEGDLVVSRAVSDISRRVSERLTVSSVAQMAGLGESGVIEGDKMGEIVQKSLDKSARESAEIQKGIADVRAKVTVPGDSTKPEPRYARLFDLLSKVERENGAYETGINNVFGMLTELNFAQVNVAIIGVENNEERLSLAILELSGEIRELTEGAARQAQQRQRDAARTIAGTTALALIVGIVLSSLLVRRLTRSVVAVSERAKLIGDTIGQDHFSHEDIAVGSTDEIGDLAAVFNQMSKSLERNILERKRFQDELATARDQAVEANRTKSDFLANMSHELRTPLNAIIGYSEMLQEEAEDLGQDDLIPDLTRINGAGKHLLELINDVLDMSKIEAGRMDIFLETFEVSNMVQEAVSLIQPLIRKGDNELEVYCPEDIGAMRADMTKVRQALFNLLSNASKFTKDGTITLRVARENVDDVPWFRFSVSDTGIGMSPVQMERVFEAFRQADQEITRLYGGIGLRLPISRSFCQMMGGDLTAESQEGEGSTFTITLPATVAEPAQEGDELDAPAASKSGTALVIDDDPDARDMTRRFLTKEGFHVVSASGGQEGLRLAREIGPDVITLDVLMPSVDGWSVLSSLKSDPQTADIPVIVLTVVDDENMGYVLGASDFLRKPIDRDQLIAILAKYRKDHLSGSVLVVEDEVETRVLMRRTLEKEGWSVAEAENGRVGLERLEEGRPGAITLDLLMPEMDGFEFVNELNRRREWRSIPIIVVTVKDISEEDRKKLSGSVEKIIQKGANTRKQIVEEIRSLVKTNAPPST